MPTVQAPGVIYFSYNKKVYLLQNNTQAPDVISHVGTGYITFWLWEKYITLGICGHLLDDCITKLFFDLKQFSIFNKYQIIDKLDLQCMFEKMQYIFSVPSDIQIMKMKSRQSLAVSNGGFVPRDLAINELASLLRYDKVDGYEELNREYQVKKWFFFSYLVLINLL